MAQNETKRPETKRNETKPRQMRTIRYNPSEILASLMKTDIERYPFPNEQLISIKKEGDDIVVMMADSK